MSIAVLSGLDAAVAFACLAVLVAALFRHGRKVTLAVGRVQATVEEVNRAVNHRAPDDDTLYQHAKATRQMLEEFVSYQHNRNHDGANEMAKLSLRIDKLQAEMRGYVVADAEAHEEFRQALDALSARLEDGA